MELMDGMEPRLDYRKASPGALRAMAELERYVRECGLEASLIGLIKLRASQINGCAYCIDMHTKEARAAGETEQRLYLLSSWREAPFYSDRERAALAWTEALTEIATFGVEDELYEEVSEHFSEKELVDLTTAIVTINGWNRFSVSFRPEVGSYEPRGKGGEQS
jgi:AhpD family alkylhydroperoxidase